MQQFTTMRLGIASFLSCLALLLGVFTSTGTVSAHTVSAQHIHPLINVFDVTHFGNCIDFRIEGENFSPNHHAVLLAATANEGDVNIDPDSVHVNSNGNFARDAQICGSFGFNNCGDFIDNPSFFCGFNLNPEDFCGNGFGFEPSQFCFPGSGFGFQSFPGSGFGAFPPSTRCQPFSGNPNPFLGNSTDRCRPIPPVFHGGPGGCSFQFQCGFRPFPALRFCGFHFLPFCFRFRHHTFTALIKAVDSHTDRESNTLEISIGNFFA